MCFYCSSNSCPGQNVTLCVTHSVGRLMFETYSLRADAELLLQVLATRSRSFGDRAFFATGPTHLPSFKSLLKTHLFFECYDNITDVKRPWIEIFSLYLWRYICNLIDWYSSLHRFLKKITKLLCISHPRMWTNITSRMWISCLNHGNVENRLSGVDSRRYFILKFVKHIYSNWHFISIDNKSFLFRAFHSLRCDMSIHISGMLIYPCSSTT
jgi:hypothetical protein